jgi:hypothetical protein
MAKQVNYTDKETGANYPTAYFRITRVMINRPNSKAINVLYEGFVNHECAIKNYKPFITFTSVIKNLTITNATDIRALIYAQDTNPIFENSIDA